MSAAAAGACALAFAGPALGAPDLAAPDLALRGASDPDHEAPVTCREGEGQCFLLLGVQIDGATAFDQAELSGLYQPYLAREVSVGDLARIADAVTAHYRDAGYFLSRAQVPPQDMSTGIAHLRVIEGRISEIEVRGPAREPVARALRGLDRAPIAELAELDRRLARAKAAPGVTLEARLEPVLSDPASHTLVVETAFEAQSGYAMLDNRGADNANPLQAFLGMRRNGLDGDQLAFDLYTTPQDARDFSFMRLAYGAALESGARVNVSAAVSRGGDGPDVTSPDVGGESASVSAQYEYPLVLTRGEQFWAGAGFDLLHVEQDWAGGGGYADEVRLLRVNLRGRLDDGGRATQVFAMATFGLDVLGASPHSTSRRSRDDADGAFARFNGQITHYRDLSRHVGLFVSLDGQWSAEPLLLSQEFSLGGLPYGRAYDPGELRGDSGLAGLVELRAGFDPDWGPISFAQTYVFLDGGQVWNKADGDDLSASLASAGFGFRVRVADWLVAQWEAARPLTRTPFDEGDKDWRPFFSLSASY